MGRLKRETVSLGMLTLVTDAAKFIFCVLLGRMLGASWQVDCFFMSTALFGMANLSNNYFTSLLIPVFNDVRQQGYAEGNVFIDVVLKWSLFVSLFVVLVFKLFDTRVIRLLAPGFDARSLALTGSIVNILLYSLVFSNIARTMIYVLNALHYYSLPAFMRLAMPLADIVFLVVFVPSYGIKALAFSSVISNGLMASVLVVFFAYTTSWLPTLRFFHPALPRLVTGSATMSLAGIIWSVRDMIVKNFASRLGEGSVALFSYAEKIISTGVQILGNSILRVYYSRMAQLISLSRWSAVADVFARVSKATMAMVLVASSAAFLFLPSMLELLFLGSRLSAHDISVIVGIVNCLLVFFVISSLETLFSRIVTAMERTGALVFVSLAGIVTAALTVAVTFQRWGLASLALAYAVSQGVACVMFYWLTRKLLGITFAGLMANFSRGALAAFFFLVLGLIAVTATEHAGIIVFVIVPLWTCAVAISFIKSGFLKAEREIILE